TALSNRNPACSLELITLTAVASGATSYTWTYGTTSTLSSVWKTAPQTTTAQIYTITVANQYGCSDSFTLEVKVNPCVGLDENTANTGISIYPNPNKGEFVISSEQAMDLQIINELGQVVKTLHINKNTTEVKLNDLSRGIYFIIGKTENGTVKEKIVIEK